MMVNKTGMPSSSYINNSERGLGGCGGALSADEARKRGFIFTFLLPTLLPREYYCTLLGRLYTDTGILPV